MNNEKLFQIASLFAFEGEIESIAPLGEGFINDKIPMMIYGKTADPDAVAAKIDNIKKSEIKRVVKGDIVDWACDAAKVSSLIYNINPIGTYDLDPKTIEKSQPIVERQLRNAGYRLAAKLNEYFDN